ncbi:hypothetical protein [Rhizobium sp. LEGMi135b]
MIWINAFNLSAASISIKCQKLNFLFATKKDAIAAEMVIGVGVLSAGDEATVSLALVRKMKFRLAIYRGRAC